jgi:hypothetical protein
MQACGSIYFDDSFPKCSRQFANSGYLHHFRDHERLPLTFSRFDKYDEVR